MNLYQKKLNAIIGIDNNRANLAAIEKLSTEERKSYFGDCDEETRNKLRKKMDSIKNESISEN